MNYALKYPFLVSDCEVSPSLPTGFVVTNECTIGGKPSNIMVAKKFNVIMSNIFETKTVTIIISAVEKLDKYECIYIIIIIIQ